MIGMEKSGIQFAGKEAKNLNGVTAEQFGQPVLVSAGTQQGYPFEIVL